MALVLTGKQILEEVKGVCEDIRASKESSSFSLVLAGDK
jgi:hypothetical protein